MEDLDVIFSIGELEKSQQEIVWEGFTRDSVKKSAPQFVKKRMFWKIDKEGELIAVLTAEVLWDWMYIDELWVNENFRKEGLGNRLIQEAEDYATSQKLSGVWLWTQSWQAAEFYRKLDYEEFTKFPDFPKNHQRIGFRKILY